MEAFVGHTDIQTDNFRAEFNQSEIPSWYRGWAHIALNLLFLLIPIIYFSTKVEKLIGTQFLIIPLMLLIGNLAVWAIHKFPLHQRWKFFSFPYDNHTKAHHRFFTQKRIIIDSSREWIIVFFPPPVVFIFSAIVIPVVFNLLLLANVGELSNWVILLSCLYFLLYEVLHFISHLPEKHILLKFFWFRYMWNHHGRHHDPKLMHKYNFGIVFPFADMILGTFFKDKTNE